MNYFVSGKIKVDKDIELQKIQTLDGNFQTLFNFAGSIVVGALIGLVITYVTLYYEGLLGIIIYTIAIVVTYVAMGICLIFMNARNNEHLEFVDELYARIEKGEALPSLMELKKQFRKKKSATEKQ